VLLTSPRREVRVEEEAPAGGARQRPRIPSGAILVFLLAVASGCLHPQRQFRVTSYPSGATVFVEGEKRGQTDMERLNVEFSGKDLVTIRLDKEGYQASGQVLGLDSPHELFFVLQEAPQDRDVLERLKRIETQLERLSAEVRGEGKAK
jgi:hypothetical protein